MKSLIIILSQSRSGSGMLQSALCRVSHAVNYGAPLHAIAENGGPKEAWADEMDFLIEKARREKHGAVAIMQSHEGWELDCTGETFWQQLPIHGESYQEHISFVLLHRENYIARLCSLMLARATELHSIVEGGSGSGSDVSATVTLPAAALPEMIRQSHSQLALLDYLVSTSKIDSEQACSYWPDLSANLRETVSSILRHVGWEEFPVPEGEPLTSTVKIEHRKLRDIIANFAECEAALCPTSWAWMLHE